MEHADFDVGCKKHPNTTQQFTYNQCGLHMRSLAAAIRLAVLFANFDTLLYMRLSRLPLALCMG